jgi:RHS repeat-associated protein
MFTQVLQIEDEEGNTIDTYLYGLQKILQEEPISEAELKGKNKKNAEKIETLYFTYDGLGSVTGLTGENGHLIVKQRFDEFGVPHPSVNLFKGNKSRLANHFGYTGEFTEEEAELLFLRARYYNPSMGRFVSRDLVEMNPIPTTSKKLFYLTNLYQYCENNPINKFDPNGLSSIEDYLHQKLNDLQNELSTLYLIKAILVSATLSPSSLTLAGYYLMRDAQTWKLKAAGLALFLAGLGLTVLTERLIQRTIQDIDRRIDEIWGEMGIIVRTLNQLELYNNFGRPDLYKAYYRKC